MWDMPYVVERIAQDRRRETLRAAERRRLIKEVQNARLSRGMRARDIGMLAVLVLRVLLATRRRPFGFFERFLPRSQSAG